MSKIVRVACFHLGVRATLQFVKPAWRKPRRFFHTCPLHVTECSAASPTSKKQWWSCRARLYFRRSFNWERRRLLRPLRRLSLIECPTCKRRRTWTAFWVNRHQSWKMNREAYHRCLEPCAKTSHQAVAHPNLIKSNLSYKSVQNLPNLAEWRKTWKKFTRNEHRPIWKYSKARFRCQRTRRAFVI